MLQNGELKTLIINVRDPVDRFVSAFRWRSIVLCHPNDTRTRSGPAAKNPHDFCKNGNKRHEEHMLRVTYKSDPNKMAEALCEDSPLFEMAKKDFFMVGHSSLLTSWLAEFFVDTNKFDDIKIQNLFVLPMEKREEEQEILFVQHIRKLSLHLLQTRYGKGLAKIIMDQNLQYYNGTDRAREQSEHSSVRFISSGNKSEVLSARSPLSPLGECCLARFLENDYRLIQGMLTISSSKEGNDGVQPLENVHPLLSEVCSYYGSFEQQKSCRSDLKSIVLRRAQYLDPSIGTCSTIVTGAQHPETELIP